VAHVSRAVAYTTREKSIIPPQVIIHGPKGTNHQVALLFGTSLYDLKQAQMQPASDLTVRDVLRMLTPALAVIRVPEAFFATSPIETRVVLASLRDVSELPRRLPTAVTVSWPAGWPGRFAASAVPKLRTRLSRP
jgi:hypothetical protein